MKTIIGYKIESNDGEHETPNCFCIFEILYTIELAETWLKTELSNPENGDFKWVIVPVFKDTIEETTFIEYI